VTLTVSCNTGRRRESLAPRTKGAKDAKKNKKQWTLIFADKNRLTKSKTLQLMKARTQEEKQKRVSRNGAKRAKKSN
jgi:hypothetical protein